MLKKNNSLNCSKHDSKIQKGVIHFVIGITQVTEEQLEMDK